jgi:hypothetical protein
MRIIKNIEDGIAGAAALNILHETIRQFDHDVPRVEFVGEEALNKMLEKRRLTIAGQCTLCSDACRGAGEQCFLL